MPNIRVYTSLILIILVTASLAGDYTFKVKGEKTYLNDQEILVRGLRLSNALISDKTTDNLIAQLTIYKSYGINCISVYFMGSRFGDIRGYKQDASIDPVYAKRMARIIEKADEQGMIVLVGCLYWGNSKTKWESWKQNDANLAIANTVAWLKQNDYKNVFVDVDNEGMARRHKGFNVSEMIRMGKKVNANCLIASNFRGKVPKEADLTIHFSPKVAGKPYIETEGTPTNAPGKYWGKYSKKDGYYNYIKIGHYNYPMIRNQIKITKEHLDKGYGYMLASTWLQCVAPFGPNNQPGGYGCPDDPGILWWLEFIRDNYGEYIPPSAGLESKESTKIKKALNK